jgi:putative acyl-CoA dehydrogenase
MPLNSIWEGSGNIMCLDVLRAIAKSPAVLEALADELSPAAGRYAALDRFTAKLKDQLTQADEAQARRLTQDIALAVQAALLIRFAPEPVAQAFCATRLDRDWGQAFGTLPSNLPVEPILARAWPVSR